VNARLPPDAWLTNDATTRQLDSLGLSAIQRLNPAHVVAVVAAH
jgi:hypothetical protein